MKRMMWLLTQLFELFLVLAGINLLWAAIKAPFVWYAERTRPNMPEPVDLVALQKAANQEYTKRIIRSLPDPTAAARRLGLEL